MGYTYAFSNWRNKCLNKVSDINEGKGLGPIDIERKAGVRAFFVELFEGDVSVEEAAQLAWDQFC
jgi:hypothetical protein